MPRDFLIVFVNGQRHDIRGERAFQSLSDFLRNDLNLVGTKIVCSEGDCGSCSVLIGKIDASDPTKLKYDSVCSCIQFLCQLDCTHIVTIEGLKYDGQLNPVQTAMANSHGSQCGFCTPGFVVSLTGMFERGGKRIGCASSADVRSACVGNLCRCTGYEAILKAGSSIEPSTLRPMNALHPPEAMIETMSKLAGESIDISNGDRRFHKASSLADAIAFRAANPDAVVIAGGTDVGVQINKGYRDPKALLSLGAIEELKSIDVNDDTISIGALASLADLERVCREVIPEFAAMMNWFGSPPIKNAGTVGGNIANGSPIADTLPAYFVLNAEVELTGPNGPRRVNINDFYTGYKKSVATIDELITRVYLPIPKSADLFKLYKVSKRKDLDISAFTAAIWMRLNADRAIEETRIAYGGVGPNVLRLRRTEDSLRGKMLSSETIRAASKIARTEITPISDVRGSEAFRLQLGENILRKFFAELSDGASSFHHNGTSNGDGSFSMNGHPQLPVRN